MEFDHFAVVILMLSPNAPDLDDTAANALQDAHMAFLAEMHQAGFLVAAGPLIGPDDQEFRGLSIFNVEPERAFELASQDPAVHAGRFVLRAFPWMVPAGAIQFTPTRFPRSLADLES